MRLLLTVRYLSLYADMVYHRCALVVAINSSVPPAIVVDMVYHRCAFVVHYSLYNLFNSS